MELRVVIPFKNDEILSSGIKSVFRPSVRVLRTTFKKIERIRLLPRLSELLTINCRFQGSHD